MKENEKNISGNDRRVHLRRGNPGNVGGGRTPGWLKEKCKDIVDRNELIEFLAAVARGDLVDERLERLPKQNRMKWVPCRASIRDRREAIATLLDRGWGKCEQAVQVTDENGKNIPFSIIVKTVTGDDEPSAGTKNT